MSTSKSENMSFQLSLRSELQPIEIFASEKKRTFFSKRVNRGRDSFKGRLYRGFPKLGTLRLQIEGKKLSFGPYLQNHDLEGLGCSERAGKLINGKVMNFYIEAIPKKFSQLQQKIFFRARSK